MRPVDRGNWPKDNFGMPKVFAEYKEACPDLINRLGDYCSYCERYIDHSLAVEHIQPKQWYPDLELNWNNFLLACSNCNSTKGAKNISLQDYYWPDRDNTACIFECKTLKYGKDEELVDISVNTNLTAFQQEKAQKSLDLTGLNNRPAKPGKSRNTMDNRWIARREAWQIAKEQWEELQEKDTPKKRKSIVKLAKPLGCWSIWMTVFREDIDMLEGFINAFTGTTVCGIITTEDPGTFKSSVNAKDSDLGKRLINVFSSTSVWMSISREDDKKLEYLVQSSPITRKLLGKPTASSGRKEEARLFDNPSLRIEPRYEPAAVIPMQQETSILDWLEASGRLLARDDAYDPFLEDEEEITELMGVDDPVYEDLEDDDGIEDELD